jgi:hypothetical protein
MPSKKIDGIGSYHHGKLRERPSIISYNSFLNHVYGDIIPPPPRPAWATTSDDDAVTPRDTEMAAFPDCPVDSSSMTQLPSSNGNDALIATRSASASNEEISRPSAPPPSLSEGSHFEDPGQDLLSPPMFSSPTFVPMDEENARPVICDEGFGDEEEKLEEEDFAPLPPEMIAASFEAVKPELIEDVDDTSVQPEQIAAPFEGHGDEEETRMDVQDDYAPVPPEMIAASFEAVMPELIDNDRAPPPPDMLAASFEGHSDEEEKREEVEDNGAPAPPEMLALSYEVNDDTKQEVKKKSEVNEDKDGANISNAQGIINSINTSGTFEPGIGANSSPEVVDSSSANLLSPFTTNGQVGVSRTLSPQSDTDPSLPVSSQDCAEIAIYPTSEMMAGPRPSIDLRRQSAPLLEAKPVQDLPEEPVYNAVPISPTQDIDAHGWSRRFQKYRVIILGLVSVTTVAIIAVGVVLSDNRNEPASRVYSTTTPTINVVSKN